MGSSSVSLQYSTDIALDESGGVVITGSFDGNVDFDVMGGGDVHISNGGKDVFYYTAEYGW